MASIKGRVSFRGKRHTVAISNTFQRHSTREHIRVAVRHHLAKLTPEGKAQAFELGKALPKGRKLKIYFSPSIRTRQTAYYLYRGHKEAGGKAARYFSKGGKGSTGSKRFGERHELMGTHLFKDEKKVQDEVKLMPRQKERLDYWYELAK